MALWLVLAALVSLAQPVAVSATHVPVQTIEGASSDDQAVRVLLHGERHNPADHVHDVAQGAVFDGLPVVGWSESWTIVAAILPEPMGKAGCERPPRASVTV